MKFRSIEATPTAIKRKESFIDRFNGRTSLMTNEGDRGVASSTNKPIEKLKETNSFLYTHLHTTHLTNNDTLSISSGQMSSPRYSLSNYMKQHVP